MRNTVDEDLPVDIWRYILLFVPPSNLHRCCLVNTLFNNLCAEPNLYKNLVCRIKCFSPVPLKIDDDTSTVSLSVYDHCTSYAVHYGSNNKSATMSKVEQAFNNWLIRLSKSKYLDLGSFPLDEEHLSSDTLNESLQNIVCNETFDALHFDGFYSPEVKRWFLSFIVPKLASEIRLISLRWDEWTLTSLQYMEAYIAIFNHFWVCIDGKSHPFHLPLYHESVLRDNPPLKFDQLQILSLYRLHFPQNTLQTLLDACSNLKVLYIFASSWIDDDHSEHNQNIMLPTQIRSISVLLCEGSIFLDKCRSNLRHIMLDSTTNSIGNDILQQLSSGIQFPQLRKISMCFWPGISDKPENTQTTTEELQIITQLIYNIHLKGNTKLFDTLSINMYQDSIQENLTNKVQDALRILYREIFSFNVTTIESFKHNCIFILDQEEDKNFIQKMFRRRFGLLRNT